MTAKRLRLTFAGTPDLAAYVLSALLSKTEHQIITVFTQPDRPAGRGQKPQFSAVKQMALKFGLDVQQPVNQSALAETAKLDNIDAMIVVAFGMIIPEPILTAPRLGCINIHTSLLPRWRGAAPIQRAIQHGDQVTGVTIMQMTPGLDTGPVIMQRKCTINPDETAGTLNEKLAQMGALTIIQTLADLDAGTVTITPQSNIGANYAHKINKQEARLNWQQSADVLERIIRAFNPAPIAWTTLNGQDLRVWEANCDMGHQKNIKPGNIIKYSKKGIEVACNPGSLILKTIQLPGKNPMPMATILNGRPTFLQGSQLNGSS